MKEVHKMHAIHYQKVVSPVKCLLVEMTGKQLEIPLLVFSQHYVNCCCIGDVNAFYFLLLFL